MQNVYWTGEIPSRPLPIHVYDSDGLEANLSTYDYLTVKILDTNNEEVDLTGSSIVETSSVLGLIEFNWPTDRSVFEEPGEYVLQLVMDIGGLVDKSSTWNFTVKELGGAN